MIYVRIELWPNGSRAESKILGEATIENLNDHSKPDKFGNYVALLSRAGGFVSRNRNLDLFDENNNNSDRAEYYRILEPVAKSVWKKVKVMSFDRVGMGPFDLVGQALVEALGIRITG